MKSGWKKKKKREKHKNKQTWELQLQEKYHVKTSSDFKNDSVFFLSVIKKSKSKGFGGWDSPTHQNHKTRRQQTTPQNANQSTATAKVETETKKNGEKRFQNHQIDCLKNLNTDKSCFGFEPSKQNGKAVKALWSPTLHRGPCWNNGMLKTWSLHVKNAPNHHVNAQIQTPAKGRKKLKIEGGQLKRPKKCLQKSHWKCTHRAGVKCCNKNVIWLKIQYGGASRNAVPFSLDLCLQMCHVTHSAPTSSNERAALNSWRRMLS